MSMALVIDLPPSETLRPDQAVGELAKLEWQEVIGIGITAEGEFEVINSEMTAERALWLIEWAKRWAMGLEVEEQGGWQGHGASGGGRVPTGPMSIRERPSSMPGARHS